MLQLLGQAVITYVSFDLLNLVFIAQVPIVIPQSVFNIVFTLESFTQRAGKCIQQNAKNVIINASPILVQK